MAETPQYVNDFIEAVYPGNSALAKAFFNEEKCLRDATVLINDLQRFKGHARPIIVCLCGSTKFKDAFTKAQLEETLAGNIVLTIGCNMKSDQDIFGHLSFSEFAKTKWSLDQLHFRKIEISDEVLILNVDGYIGLSTCDELNYAKALGKKIRFLENPL